ncbi:hypothetical protein SAMN05421765_1204 [Kaistella antarctica]|uniref:Uncharacterized protein n=1 Tax=Kaistella antarctica TaxID=266748 RepID=A0A3S4YP26_9FLAO|nr:hypothetical protein SAMN05421765_1204 [Kaistella antarctica]VEH95039.1 Uncharacterised protein [Kaistella antarctica]
MCLCAYKIYILYYPRLSCLFVEKGKKTSELVFFKYIFQIMSLADSFKVLICYYKNYIRIK